MKNKVQLISYADRLGNDGLVGLRHRLQNEFKDLFGGVHILPFYNPIDGADAGFDPVDHLSVDERIGTWDSIQEITNTVEVVADLVVNHISADSQQFLDFLEQGDRSEYAGMFLTVDYLFPGGVDDSQMEKVYRPHPSLPIESRTLSDGSKRQFWSTFSAQQIDLDVNHPKAQEYLRKILNKLASTGVSLVRLDAVGFSVKKPGTSCFLIPETYEFISMITTWANKLGMEVLAETHTHHENQTKVASHVNWVYDFCLPPLVLHSFYRSTAIELKEWFSVCPQNMMTVLDTHDGIGVLDVGPDPANTDVPGILTTEQIEEVIAGIHRSSNGVSEYASSDQLGNLDLTQINCTYFSALGSNENDYLLARLIQFFAPGIPQIYYVGLLAGVNDEGLVARTKVGRDINRHYYSTEEIINELESEVVQALFRLIRFRNNHPAFSGEFILLSSADHILHMRRELDEHWAELELDFQQRSFNVQYSDGSTTSAFSSF